MRISYEWLKRHVDLPEPPTAVAERMTMAGLAVAAVEPGPGQDHTLVVEVGWNRPDWLSHVGVAREVAGLYGLPLRTPPDPVLPAGEQCVPVAVEDGDLCPLYTARVVSGLRVGASPEWLVRLLEAAGQRSVNDVVDVTNFVLLETGQPLHAFDLARLDGGRLVARRAQGEVVTALDGSRLELVRDDLVIADARGPVALAGVMGLAGSEVLPGTTDVVLESALFAPLAVRAASRRHQLRSESSHRFERRVDPDGVRRASDLAAALLVELCGARTVGPLCEAGPGPAVGRRLLDLRLSRVERVLGLAVPASEVRAVLGSLGFEEVAPEAVGAAAASDSTRWAVPSWRADVREEVDLVEEVARRVGFDRVPAEVRLPVRPLTVDPARRAQRRVRAALVAAGLRECCTDPFVGAGPLDVCLFSELPALVVENPMRAEESLLRRSLLGPLLRVVRNNRDRGVTAVRLFETAPVYLRGPAPGGTEELPLVSGVLSGDYADAKGCVEALLGSVGLATRLAWERGAPAPFSRDRCATVRLVGQDASGGQVLGHLGELGPSELTSLGLEAPLAAFELRSDLVVEHAELDPPYRPVSRYPGSTRDLAWVVPEEVTWGAVERVVRSAAGALLTELGLLSVFRGPQVGTGQKSVAFRMELRAADRTLTSDDAEQCVAGVVLALAEATGGHLRG
jgi:phenylalanyl-tRNA synthetase beta chain